ncbi:hypothetical protein VSU16_04760 [Cetobacterium somerae]|uniref:hypothetical protein n=1 Tax=Cetobacterium somerae TaxID=188913 RepID=UPI002E7BDE94|nr:hypothetical protein [Cetobacterium somerae]WVJ02055.1 hypothetical protein VSU16_04760 [Cetobacterium somerae]
MGNTITSKNSWELLLSSIAGAFDGADTFVLGTFDEAENYAYKTVITNHRTNEEISKYITAIKLNVPDSGDKISSIKATFDLEDLIVQNDDYVTIKILNSTESAEITVLKGKVKILKRDINMMNLNHYSVEIVDEFNKLFEKTVTEDIFLFDKYIYSEQYKENSILYIISKKLGFTDEQMNFEDVRDSQSRLVKIPFILFRKNNRYIDELQTLLDVTKGRMYIDNMEQIVFENGLFEYEKAIAYPFDVRNILKNVGIDYKYTDKNGVRVVYDSYKNLANQVIFDLANKVEVAPTTTSATAKELGIKFITDLATQHNITKAEGYYYENEQQIRVPLLLNTHYEVIEFSETSAKVKFLNPYASKFYIDKFEIKGIPLAMFSDNEVSVKATKDMLENEENFSSYNKNKYIQTEELASDIARVEYIRNCKNKKEYSFKSNFVPHLEPGDICTLKINDIDTLIQISTIEHTLSRSNGFYSEIVALEYEKIEQEFNYSKLESLTAKDSFLGTLNNIKDQVDETDKKLEEVILIEGARGYVDENDPRDSGKPVAEPDVWFNPVTKEFKVWRNGKWNPAREEDIPPALSVALKAQAGIFRIGGTDTEAGIFFQYDKDTKNPVFGSTDSENLAQVSIDKKANVLIRNPNNKLAFNMRNPENPSEIISQLLMGVYNADDGERHKDTLFQVGDESTGTYLRFLRDGKFTQQIDNKEIKQYFKEFENQIDGKINTFSQSTDPSVNWTEEEKLKSVGDLWYNPTTKVTKRWNGTTWEEQDVKDKVAQEIAKSKNTVFVSTPVPPYKIGDLWIKNEEIYDCISVKESGVFAEGDWKKSTKYTDDTTANNAINNQNNGHLTVNANTVFDGKATFVSKGNNETTVIQNGSITFTRDGQNITTIRNMRSGVISTNSNGSGVVDFVGMKTNLSVMTTIKSFNISQNIRSLHCYAEMIDIGRNRWKFVIGGTEASVNGNNENVYSFSYSRHCASLSVGNIVFTPSNNVIRSGQENSTQETGFQRDVSIHTNPTAQITITYNDGLGSSRVIYSSVVNIPITFSNGNSFNQQCGPTGIAYRQRIIMNPLTISVNQSFNTFNLSTKSLTISIAYPNKSVTLRGDSCGYKNITYSFGNNLDNVSYSVSYTTEHTQSLVGSGEVQYIAIEQ